MQASDVEIHTGGVDRPYKSIGRVEAKRSKASILSADPTLDEVEQELRSKAAQLGANAILNFGHSRGMTLMSYQVLKAWGDAVILESDDVACPFCAETIKRAAIKCRHCGEMLPAR